MAEHEDPMAAEGSPPEAEAHATAAEEKRRKAADEVIASVGPPADKLFDHPKLLAEVHRAPPERWSSLVLEILNASLDHKAVKERVAEIKAE